MLAYFHGGGFVLGLNTGHDWIARGLCHDAGCIVSLVDYRLAPEAPFPAAPEDAFAALLWMIEHAAAIGGDPKRVAVAGDSAGGNLAAVVSLMARDRGAPSIAHQLLIYLLDGCSSFVCILQGGAICCAAQRIEARLIITPLLFRCSLGSIDEI